MTGRARVGCSGWSYPGWRGRVYPPNLPSHGWFAQYAAQFDTVELNNTFYRLPLETTILGWARQAPADFCYAVKVGRFGTHRKKLKDPEGWLGRHLERTAPLGAHLGPQLVQLPPRWRMNLERLEGFLEVAPRDRRWAVELRDPSWLHDDVFSLLARYDAALCVHDLLPDHPWERTASWSYVRFHGPDAPHAPYRGRYGPERLEPVATRLEGWLAAGDVFAYFNNDTEAHAVSDAAWLRDRLRS